jgi:hypothetical protein
VKGCVYSCLFISILFLLAAVFCSDDKGSGPPEGESFIRVPSDIETIQLAIDSALVNDTIIIEDGRYYERISFRGKDLTVASEFLLDNDSNHILNTIIDGDTSVLGTADTGCVVLFADSETESAILYGLTITGGTGLNGYGGGIISLSASPTISHCIIASNVALYGGGFYCEGGRPSFIHCLIHDNEAGYTSPAAGRLVSHNYAVLPYTPGGGGGIVQGSTSTITYCSFERNEALNLAGGLFIVGSDSVDVSGSSFNYNRSDQGSGGIYIVFSWITIDGCAFNNNTAELAGGAMVVFSSIGRIDHSYYSRNSAMQEPVVYGLSSTLTFSECVFSENVVENSGSHIYVGDSDSCSFYECTVSHNISIGEPAAVINIDGTPGMTSLVRCIVSDNQNCRSLVRAPSSIDCTDIYGNTEGDWVDAISDFEGVDGNISADPQFCNAESGDYTLRQSSPCAAENSECGERIGAFDTGCQ